MSADSTLSTDCLDVIVHSLHTDCVAYDPKLRLLAVTCYQLNEDGSSSSSQSREGSVYFYQVAYLTDDKPQLQACSVEMSDGTKNPHLACPSGVFDIRWCPSQTSLPIDHETASIITLALADGSVRRLKVLGLPTTSDNSALAGSLDRTTTPSVRVELLESIPSEASDDMAIGVDVAQLDFRPGADSSTDDSDAQHPETTPSYDTPLSIERNFHDVFAVGYQSGAVAVFDAETPALPVWSCPDAHMAEVWQTQFLVDLTYDSMISSRLQATSEDATGIANFTSQSTALGTRLSSLLVSGSDDASFKIWDIRSDPSRGAVLQNTKHYQMGVTSFASPMASPCAIARSLVPSMLFIGSYDESLSMWDLRQMRRPIESIGLGGGVWRLRWLPSASRHSDTPYAQSPLLAVACMHAGFKVVELNATDGNSQPTLRSVASYWGPHTGSPDGKFPPLAYGIDWIGQASSDRRSLALSGCTFYDNRASLWSLK